ncbi:PREDICTED: acyl-lipid (8-3)-desaturase-like [Amphimedon queenslandica]|uniref:Cytochrome b5 heme-binding domain-containing protein n=1 Tax=Amphimedon queenslandica TaxID=400682 RepID=A0A1X7UQY0_AMPQE|nr:PREDICTED: acyl-lipid (8-3)-desaturase-like [Amphimedon queenslandica]|eukprot:XP_011404277.2 PREDICTED: acyl-lipid (8-3)-desaturase-like [Amphimedon queenslandica]
MGSPEPLGAVKHFTWKELSALNKRENAHVAHNGKVYDVSSFVSSHPGGVDQIMLGAGHDITHLFNVYHQPQTMKVLEKYYVGELIDNEMPVYAEDKTQFYPVLKKRVKEHFKSLNIDPKIDYRMFSLYLFFLFFWVSSWYGMLRYHDSWLGVACSFALGWCSCFVLFNFGHDLSHFAITHKPWIWKVGGFITVVMGGFSMYCWTYQHTYGHHNYTNVNGVDPDTKTNDIDFWRIKHKQNWIKRYRLQYIYMPMLYCFLAIKMKMQDFSDILSLQKGTIRMNPPSTFQLIKFYVAKFLHFSLVLFIPMMIMPLKTLILYHFIYELVYGFITALITVVNHVNTDLAEIQPDETNDKKWAEYQVLTTKDYATDSLLCTLLTGALNHQVAHHLFPDVLQSYYPIITPIVRDTCKEFGIQYNCETSFLTVVKEHLIFLFKMGQEPAATQYNKEQ